MSTIIIYNASAGSGKTYQIALSYLHLLSYFKKDHLRNLIAITFTNKAAFEMKERVINFLKEIVKQTKKGKDLSQKTSITPEQASELLEHIFLNYEFLQIKTIDSFLLVLYRALAYELGISANFQVKRYIDENLIEKALTELYEDAIKNTALKIFLEHFLEHLILTSDKLRLNFRGVLVRTLTTLVEKITYHKSFLDCLELKQRELEDFVSRKVLTTELDETEAYLYFYGLLKAYLEKVLARERSLFLGHWKERLTSFLTSEKNYIPWIYVKLGNLVGFIIDEFQDTDRLQWEALSPIISDLVSKGGYLICAGDPKQSIFRWKGGDPFLFEEILNGFSDYDIREEVLDRNYRSCENIINFNNVFFLNFKNSSELKREVLRGLIFSKEDHKEVDTESLLNVTLKEFETLFSHIEQKPVKNLEGRVEVIRLKIENSGGEKDLTLSIRESLKQKILEILKSLAEKDELEDISILCRKNEEVTEISSFLINEGYNVVATSYLHLKESPVVNTFVSLLKFVLNEKDEIALAGFLSGPFLDEGKEVLKDYYVSIVDQGYKDGLLNFLKERKRDLWDSILFPILQAKELLSLYELCLRIVQHFKLEEKVFSEMVYLYKFLTVVLQFYKKGGELRDFLVYWDKYSEDEIDVPEDKKAIKVLTIHQAKGLEFKTVIFPLVWREHKYIPELNLVFFNGKVFKGKKEELPEEGKIGWYMEKARERLELLNLLYVGFTRAIKNLYILVPEIERDDFLVAKVFNKIYSSLRAKEFNL